MSSRKGAAKRFIAGTSGSSPKGKSVSQTSSLVVDRLSHGVEDINLSAQDGAREGYAKKMNRGGRVSSSKALGNPNLNEKLGMRSSGSVKGPTSGLENYIAPPPLNPLPLKDGWARAASTRPLQHGLTKNEISSYPQHVDGHSDSNEFDDYSDDELLSDEFDSDSSQKSHETRKKNRWFMAFFDSLDKLDVEKINEPTRKWQCPACQDGPGAIHWYPGLNPLMAHAKSKRSKRAMLHRELAELLDEELRGRGISVVPAGEAFGKWEGLIGDGKDHEIVWPPMVVIRNTRLHRDENDMWTGMGNQELLDYFSSYRATKARHSYGPQGHRGMSVLIFESSAVGYLEAEKLDKHFTEQGRDREAWDSLFYPGRKRQLYGYLAAKRDVDIFNKHSQVKARLKFEMRSHQEMVLSRIKQMSEDFKEQGDLKDMKQTFGVLVEKHANTLKEISILRKRIKMHHEQSKEEMEGLEQFYKDQLKNIPDASDVNNESFELMLQEEHQKVKQSNASSVDDHRSREIEVEKLINLPKKEMGEYVKEREKLFKNYEDEKIAMKLKFDTQLNQLEAKYTPHSPE